MKSPLRARLRRPVYDLTGSDGARSGTSAHPRPTGRCGPALSPESRADGATPSIGASKSEESADQCGLLTVFQRTHRLALEPGFQQPARAHEISREYYAARRIAGNAYVQRRRCRSGRRRICMGYGKALQARLGGAT